MCAYSKDQMERQTSHVFHRCLIYLLMCIVGIQAGDPITTLRRTEFTPPILPEQTNGHRDRVYASHTTGTDSVNCGSQYSPCKTLLYSLGRLQNGGSLFLNGTDSHKHPYTCGPTNATNVFISLTISSWYTQAHVSCEISFNLISSPGLTLLTRSTSFPASSSTSFFQPVVTELKVILKNLSFIGGAVSCCGLCSVHVCGCSFSNGTTALRLNGSLLRNLNVTKTTFYNNEAAINVSNAVPGIITIANSIFHRNGPQPVVKLSNIQNDNEMQIQIHDSVFQNNTISPPLTGSYEPGDSYLISIQSRSVGIIAFYRNNFTSNAGGGIFVDGCSNSTFENLLMNDMSSNALKIVNTIKIDMENCLINGTVRDAIFVSADQITMILDNVTVQSNKGTAFSFSAENGILRINNSVFAHNAVKDKDRLLFAGRRDIGESTFPTDITKREDENTMAAGDPIKVDFQNTRFLKNRGLRSIIRLSCTSTRLSNVTFIDNIVEGRGGDVYISKNNNVYLHNSQFIRSLGHYYASAFVYSDSESYSFLSINDSGFESNSSKFDSTTIFDLRYGINISTDDASNITCPMDRFLRNTINIKQGTVNFIEDNYKASCEKCQVGFYNLDRVYFITEAAVNTKRCLACPYGGDCSHGIVARPNFWGYLVSKNPPTVAFHICPLEYCSPVSRLITSYKSCYGNRGGFLCGHCREGYTEAMFSTECRERENCNDYYFWFFGVAYVICLSFLLMTRPRLFEMLWKSIVWFRHRNDGSSSRSSPRYVTARDGHSCNEQHFDHAAVKMIFYFYQIAELLLIAISPEDLLNRVKFIRPMISAFNFEIRSWNEKFGCPFPGLTVVTKQLFSSLTVFGTISCISITCLVHEAMSYCTGCLNSPRFNLYLAAGVETLLLGYERLTEISLSLLNCVPVNSEWRLFLDGNIHCWQWWQYVLLSYIVVFVVPFILVLYWGSRKLNHQSVSTQELAMACIIPLPMLCFWTIRHCFQRELPAMRWQNEDTEEIKIVLQEPFRPPEEEDEGTLYWESVLIGRRLVLLCVHSFVADPMLRLLCLDLACMAILVHHLYKKPYRDTIANACESVSLFALVIIATINLAEASLVSEGIEVSGPRAKMFDVFEWIEVVLLGVAPACLCVLAVLAVLSQFFRLFYHVIMFFRKQLVWLKWRFWGDPLSIQRPLL